MRRSNSGVEGVVPQELPFPTLLSSSRSSGTHKPGFHGHSHGTGGHSHRNSPRRSGGLLITRHELSHYAQSAWSGVDSRRVMIYLAALAVSVFARAISGLWAQESATVAKAFQTLCDSAAVTFSLISMMISRAPQSFRFSYGLSRVEILAGCIHSLFLLYTGATVAIEALHHFYSPTEDISESTYHSAWIAVIAYAIGLVSFRHYSKLTQYESAKAFLSHGARECNLHGCFLHALGSLILYMSVIISYVLQGRISSMSVAIFCLSSASAVLLVTIAVPLFRRSTQVLMQCIPEHSADQIHQAVQKINTSEGVLECRNSHWWSQSPTETVGSVHVRVRADADEQTILNQVTHRLRRFISSLTVQIEKDQNIVL